MVIVDRLLLVRHGETELNARGHYVSTSDPSLNATGRGQVAALAGRLGDLDVDRVISSPKLRCRQTAEAIVRSQGSTTDLQVDDRLVELGFGEFEGLSQAQIADRGWNDAFKAWRQGCPPVYPAGAETFGEAALRMVSVYDGILASGLGTVVVVGHSHALRILLAAAVLQAPADSHRRLRLDHARFAEIRWEGDAPRITALNAGDFPAVDGTG